jgi:DNA-binding Xre family transcriptional regulator
MSHKELPHLPLKVQNRFAELLAKKERVEERSISRRMVVAETGISLSSVQNWATNNLTRFDAHQIAMFCNYLQCEPGDLIVLAEDKPEEGQRKTPLAAIA